MAKDELAKRDVGLDKIDYGILGLTVPQRQSFYGLPWVTGMMGAAHIPGPTISQACATSARCLQSASQKVRDGAADVALVLTADRTSNGPHVYYPAPHRFPRSHGVSSKPIIAALALIATLTASPPSVMATDTDEAWRAGVQDIWELSPLIPDPSPLAIIGVGLLAMGFVRLFQSAD